MEFIIKVSAPHEAAGLHKLGNTLTFGKGQDVDVDFDNEITIRQEGEKLFLRTQNDCNVDDHIMKEGEIEIFSGSVVKSFDLSFSVIKKFELPKVTQKPDVLALFAKILIVFVLIVQVFVAIWLPQRLRQGNLFADEIAYQKTTALMDDVRISTWKYLDDLEGKPELLTPLVKEINSILDEKAWEIRSKRSNISREYMDQLYTELLSYKKAMNMIKNNFLTDKLPEVDKEALLKTILEKK